MLLCFPLWEQWRQGQLSLILLALITGTWAADRSGRLRLAGGLLGLAIAIKIFPGFHLLYYVLRRRWNLVAGAVLTVTVANVIATAVLGVLAYRDYFTVVLPEIQWFRVGWDNCSLWGFWSRLFDPVLERARDRSLSVPLYHSPVLAMSLSLLSCAGIVGLLISVVRRGDEGQRADLTFAAAVTSTLLVSPVCWGHYLTVLLVPLAVAFVNLPNSTFTRALFILVTTALWLGYPPAWTAFDLKGRPAMPLHSLTVLSYHTYALLCFLALALIELRGTANPDSRTPLSMRRTFCLCAVVMAMLWVHVAHSIWRDYGLFYLLGGDYGIYHSTAEVIREHGPQMMYDSTLVAEREVSLMKYYGPGARGVNIGPWPYPAVFVIPFIPLTVFPPAIGFLTWSALSLSLAYLVARGMAARLPAWGPGFVASCVLFFPVGFALMFGQITMLFVYGFYRSYRCLERGRELSAGLWGGALYIKPQFVAFLFLVLLYKRRWRTLGGLIVAGVIVVLGSFGFVGTGGMHAYVETLRSMAGFRDVIPIVSPSVMISWRGLLASILPKDATEEMGGTLALLLSLLTVATLLLIWRGPWNARCPRFPQQMLATVIVMMLAGFHTHIHSAALLVVPALAIAASNTCGRALTYILLIGLYAPLVLFFATASTRFTAWLLIAVMVAVLATVVMADYEPGQSRPAHQPA